MFPFQLQFVHVVLYVMACVYLCVYEYTQVGIGSPYLVFGVISWLSFSLVCLLIHSFLHFIHSFAAGFHCVPLAGLELTMKTRAARNLDWSQCLCLPWVGIKGMNSPSPDPPLFLNIKSHWTWGSWISEIWLNCSSSQVMELQVYVTVPSYYMGTRDQTQVGMLVWPTLCQLSPAPVSKLGVEA